MNSYDSDGYLAMILFFGFIGLLIWIAIIKWIINSSTKTEKRFEIEKQQLQVLNLIAIKLGVNPEDIQNVLVTPKDRKRDWTGKIKK